MTLTLTSEAFTDGGPIPAQFTCEGENVSPDLQWDGVPEQTQSLVLIVDDPDAPDPRAPKLTFVHWVLYNIPPDAKRLPVGVDTAGLPPGTEQGINNWNKPGYGGPCPPVGQHRYFHKLYALDTKLSGLSEPTKDEVLKAMAGHVIDQVELVGTYEKSNYR